MCGCFFPRVPSASLSIAERVVVLRFASRVHWNRTNRRKTQARKQIVVKAMRAMALENESFVDDGFPHFGELNDLIRSYSGGEHSEILVKKA